MRILLSVVVAAGTYISSVTGALSQLRAFIGWESNAEGLKATDEAIDKLRDSQDLVGGRWAIDRLVLIANTHRSLRSSIAERLADFVRASTVNDSIHIALMAQMPTLEVEPDLDDMLNKHFKTPLLADYAFRQLGRPPFVDARRVDDDKLNLRNIIIPQARARYEVYRRVDLTDAILLKSALTGTRFESCNLTGCVLSRSSLEDVAIKAGNSLKGARVVNVHTRGDGLDSAVLARALFSRAPNDLR